MVEGGEAVVDRGVRPQRQLVHLDARKVAVFVAEGGVEEVDALVAAVDEQAGGDDGRLGAAGGAGVGHELAGAGVRRVEGESAGLPVEFGGGLQMGGVVAVVDLGAQEGAYPAHGGVLVQVTAVVVVVVQQAAEEEVVVNAGDGAQAAAALDDGGPLVQTGQEGGVGGEVLGLVQGVVHQVQPLVGAGGLLGRGTVGAVAESGIADQTAPGAVDAFALAAPAEEQPGQLAGGRPLRRGLGVRGLGAVGFGMVGFGAVGFGAVGRLGGQKGHESLPRVADPWVGTCSEQEDTGPPVFFSSKKTDCLHSGAARPAVEPGGGARTVRRAGVGRCGSASGSRRGRAPHVRCAGWSLRRIN